MRIAVVMAFLILAADPIPAHAVRPFITDDARIVKKGHFEDETFGGAVMLPHDKPAYEFGSIEAYSFTSRFELSADINDWRYQDRQMQLQDVLIQPKVLIYQSFGKMPSLSASAGVLMPASGNTQHWDNYAMAQVSWFLFRPQEPKHPYDHWLTIHLNLGTKARYDPVRLIMR